MTTNFDSGFAPLGGRPAFGTTPGADTAGSGVLVEVTYDGQRPSADEPGGLSLASLPPAPGKQALPHMSTRGACWDCFRCSGGYALTFTHWPSETELTAICDVLLARRWWIHYLTVALPNAIPSDGGLREIVDAVLSPFGDMTQIGIWHRNKLIQRYNGYRPWRDPCRRTRPYLASNWY